MKLTGISIRPATLNDLPEMQRLFVDTILDVCRDDYSPAQLAAWTSSVENKPRWMDKLTRQYFRIAVLDSRIVGYASLEGTDYLDFLYVHKDYQRQGLADALYAEIEQEARRRDATVLNSDVSKTARPFFERKGFEVVTPQTVVIQGVDITNFRMTKRLG